MQTLMRPSSALRVAALLVLALTLAACQPGSGPRDAADAVREVVREAVGGDAQPAEPGAPPPDGAPQPPADPAAPPPDGGGESAPVASVPDDHAPLGRMCRAYLRADVPRLVVEVSSQQGAAPTAAALDHLVTVLRSVVDKPGGVALVDGPAIPGGARTWTLDELRALAGQHRANRSSGEQAVMKILALRGEFERDAIGVAFDATTFALFPDRIGTLAMLLGGRTALERAVLVHEAGHLLCLVNVSYRSVLDHEDPEHPHHSRDRGSVMFWAIETSAVAQLFSGPPPDDFAEADRADLEGLRTGRY